MSLIKKIQQIDGVVNVLVLFWLIPIMIVIFTFMVELPLDYSLKSEMAELCRKTAVETTYGMDTQALLSGEISLSSTDGLTDTALKNDIYNTLDNNIYTISPLIKTSDISILGTTETPELSDVDFSERTSITLTADASNPDGKTRIIVGEGTGWGSIPVYPGYINPITGDDITAPGVLVVMRLHPKYTFLLKDSCVTAGYVSTVNLAENVPLHSNN